MASTVTMPLIENGVGVHFPDANFFQFEGCRAYNSLKGLGVKEMDVAWLDAPNAALWFVELKAFYDTANPKHQATDLITDTNKVEEFKNEFINKAKHTLAMLFCNRAGTQTCIVPDSLNAKEINLVFLVKIKPGQDLELNILQNEVQRFLQPYKAIYKLSKILLVSADNGTAKALMPWIL